MVRKKEETIFSKISLNLVIDHVCYHGNRQSDCCTGCLKYLFESLSSVLLENIQCPETILILYGIYRC